MLILFLLIATIMLAVVTWHNREFSIGRERRHVTPCLSSAPSSTIERVSNSMSSTSGFHNSTINFPEWPLKFPGIYLNFPGIEKCQVHYSAC